MYSIFSTIHMPVKASSPWMLVVAIILATFVHEDLATIVVGIAGRRRTYRNPVRLPGPVCRHRSGRSGTLWSGATGRADRFSVKLLTEHIHRL